MLVNPSVSRVQRNTAEEINQKIADATAARVRACAAGGDLAIAARLAELDREWDIERVLATGAPVGILLGLLLGLTKDRRLFLVPAAIAAGLIVHGVQGWLPPLPLLRRLGLRTPEEIDEERYALRAVRGDFSAVASDPELAIAAVKH